MRTRSAGTENRRRAGWVEPLEPAPRLVPGGGGLLGGLRVLGGLPAARDDRGEPGAQRCLHQPAAGQPCGCRGFGLVGPARWRPGPAGSTSSGSPPPTPLGVVAAGHVEPAAAGRAGHGPVVGERPLSGHRRWQRGALLDAACRVAGGGGRATGRRLDPSAGLLRWRGSP